MLLRNLKNKEDTKSKENLRKPEGGTKSWFETNYFSESCIVFSSVKLE